jgi:hypothetical protein
MASTGNSVYSNRRIFRLVNAFPRFKIFYPLTAQKYRALLNGQVSGMDMPVSNFRKNLLQFSGQL